MVKKKINIVIICPYPRGMAPSQRFRFEQYLEILQSRSYDFYIAPFFGEQAWRILYLKGHFVDKVLFFLKGLIFRTILLFKITRYDFVFIHREALPLGPPIFEFLIANVFKKKIIYDFDDAIWLPNTSRENRLARFFKWHHKVKSICKWSSRISCGNMFLAEFARQYNTQVTVNPTTIDTENLHRAVAGGNKESNPITIGWTGTHSTMRFLLEIEDVLQQIQEKYKDRVRFLVISDRAPELAIEFDFIKWNKSSEIQDLLKFDIGIMPLPNDNWSKGKCGFKVLQYMALEIPAIASPVGVNETIIRHGINGFLCSTEQEWFQAFCQLIDGNTLRAVFGKEGRKKVLSHYSVASNTPTFLSLFE